MTKATGKSKNKKPLQTTLGKAPVCISSDESDLSHLQKPIDTSIFGLREVLGLFKTATEEVQNYVTYECDIMYECRICRTIFRSLANFVLHKRKYCRELYRSKNAVFSNKSLGDTNIYIVSDEEEKDFDNNDENTNDQKHRDLLANVTEKDREDIGVKAKDKRSLCTILTRLIEKQESALITEECLNDGLGETKPNVDIKNNVLLQKIRDSKSGVFQTTFESNDQEFDYMRTEVMEIHNVLENNEAVIGTDGKIVKADCDVNSVLKNNLTCTKCDETFSTKKTLRCHVKYRHNSSRKIYKCTDCSDTFANTWGVFRHLYKAHRKTPAQVKKLRNQICNNLISRSEESELKNNEESANKVLGLQEKLDLENKQWLNDLESDNDLQICGGCGRKFERKAALNSHSHFCTKRIALCNSIKENSVKRLQEEKGKVPKFAKASEFEEKNMTEGLRRRKPLVAHKILRFDYCKDNLKKCEESKQEPSLLQSLELVETSKESDLEVFEESGNLKKDNENAIDPEPIENDVVELKIVKEKVLANLDTQKTQTENIVAKLEPLIETSDCSEVNKRKMKDAAKIPTGTKRKCKEWHALHFKSINYIDKEKNTCVPCTKSFKSSKSLMKHMAGHFNWNRYRCKTCPYKSYQRSKCESHVEKIHRIADKDAFSECILRMPHKKTIELATDFTQYTKKCNNSMAELKVSEDSDNKTEIQEKTSDLTKVTAEPEQSGDNSTAAEVEKDSSAKSPDSSVRKMIMEVIFGSEVTSSTTSVQEINETEKSSNKDSRNVDVQLGEDEVHEEPQESVPSLPLRDSRPVRNRTATVKEDFLYDMTQILKLKPSKPKGPVDFIRKQKPLKMYSRKTKLNSTPQTKTVNNKNFKLIDDINMNNKTIPMSNNNTL